MTKPKLMEINPKLDLVLERVVDVPIELVWKAWTQPEHLKKWFVPKPWSVVDCEVDLRPGGAFRSVMQSPEGQKHDNTGCYLEIVKNEKLVWTSALLPGYRPVQKTENKGDCSDLIFTAMILLEPQGNGTKYTAIAIHGEESSKDSHEKMGFYDGWGKCLDQLVESIKNGEI